jgi:hypothetical protein
VFFLAVLAVLWLAVLIPSAIRRHAHRQAATSMGSFRRSLRALRKTSSATISPANRLHGLDAVHEVPAVVPAARPLRPTALQGDPGVAASLGNVVPVRVAAFGTAPERPSSAPILRRPDTSRTASERAGAGARPERRGGQRAQHVRAARVQGAGLSTAELQRRRAITLLTIAGSFLFLLVVAAASGSHLVLAAAFLDGLGLAGYVGLLMRVRATSSAAPRPVPRSREARQPAASRATRPAAPVTRTGFERASRESATHRRRPTDPSYPAEGDPEGEAWVGAGGAL